MKGKESHPSSLRYIVILKVDFVQQSIGLASIRLEVRTGPGQVP